MSAPDQQAALDWVKACQEAVITGMEWRPVSDRFIRSLPEKDRVAPWLFAALIHGREKTSGDDPLAILDVIEKCLLIIDVAGAES